MKPLIKWPGGKSRELGRIEPLIPGYDRYIEPFFGGGALFFHLEPRAAVINDISGSLIQYYRLVKAQDSELKRLLLCYSDSFHDLLQACDGMVPELLRLFEDLKNGVRTRSEVSQALGEASAVLADGAAAGAGGELLLDRDDFAALLHQMAEDKLVRTIKNHEKKPYPIEDLRENLVTGFMSGYYMYFRKVYNDMRLGKTTDRSIQYQTANFYFIREYCYGSMFRYNVNGEFNIPYGGMTYNRKDMAAKIHSMFSRETEQLFANTDIHCSDFERFLAEVPLTPRDLMFLDPPYDTDFSDYEGTAFTQWDHERLADALQATPAQFILVIKNTDFIRGLYEGRGFHIRSFDKFYSYNVRSRNNREAEHLIITDLPV